MRHGPFAGVVLATIKDFGFDDDAHVSFSKSEFVGTAGVAVGYEVFRRLRHKGFGGAFETRLFLPMDLGTLETNQGSNVYTACGSKAFLYTFDLVGYLYPFENVDLGARLMFGIEAMHATYDFDPGRNTVLYSAGPKSFDGATAAFGLGLSFGFLGHVHAVAEARWLTMSVSDEYTSEPGSDLAYKTDHNETYAPMLSFAMLVNWAS
ncbi:MAG: hypothetical protein JW940_20865 [Polyangiaceae bacterium]|nr:hypothetical protein [Polyangiaceae bacterium]